MTIVIIAIAGFLIWKNWARIKGYLTPSMPPPPPMMPGPYGPPPGWTPPQPDECPTCHQPLGQVTHP